MAETTGISWADRTWSPWIGCTRVSPACEGCYAAHLMETRMGRVAWGGPGAGEGTRDRTSAAYWRKPLAWNREAAASGERPFVFPSLCDPFDNAVDPAWRRDFFDLIRATPHLVWLLLTKRPGQIRRLFEQVHQHDASVVADPSTVWPPNAWLGATFANQDELNCDGPKLLAAKSALGARLAFASFEPLLGSVDARPFLSAPSHLALASTFLDAGGVERSVFTDQPIDGVDWVITGGETDQGAHKARPSDPQWFRDLRDQCAAAGVAFHHKQNGEWAPGECASHPAHRSEDVAWRVGDEWVSGRLTPSASAEMHCEDEPDVFRFGKKRAGRWLDGVVHDARPQVAA